MRVTLAKIAMPIWKNDCNRGKMKFNAAAAQCCIYGSDVIDNVHL